MKTESKISDFLFNALAITGIIGSIISVIIASYLVITYTVGTNKPSDSTIFASILAVMLFIAISNLDRYRKLRHIDIQAEETRDLIEKRIVHQVRADAFFNESSNLNENYFSTASTISIVGITLGNTTRAFVDVLGRRLKSGANIRLILASTEEEVLRQIVQRSFGQPIPATDYYKNRIEATLTLIKIIASISDATGTLEVGMLPYIPSFGMTLIDANSSNGKSSIKIYHHNSQKPPPKFELTTATDPKWAYFFNEQFELMWKRCEVKQILVDGNLLNGQISPA